MNTKNIKDLNDEKNKINNYKVYVHISPSLKYYVGITMQDVYRRWRPNGYGYQTNDYFWRAIKKYGWDNFEHEIIASNLTKDEAEKFEIALIKQLDCKSPNGYNHESGGIHNGAMSEETKRKLSLKKIGKLTRYNSGIAKPVNLYTFDGKYLKTYSNMSDLADYLGVTIGNVSQCCNGAIYTIKGYQTRYCVSNNFLDIEKVKYKDRKNQRKINKYDSCKKLIEVYNSVTNAAKDNNLSMRSIRYSCVHHTLSKGFYYEYAI